MRHLNTALAACFTVLLAGSAAAQTAAMPEVALGSPTLTGASLQALGALLVLAVLIENALAVIFGWNVYRAFFSVTGTKTLVAFIVSYLVVRHFEVDVIASLLAEYSAASYPSTIGTEALTALVVAGGSAGVRNVMAALGYRDKSDDRDPAPAPAPEHAWISVSLKRQKAVGPVRISVEEVEAAEDLPTFAGVVSQRRRSLADLLLRGVNRFPANGGYSVTPGKTYVAKAMGVDAHGGPVSQDLVDGPFRMAPGAVVDFDVTV